MPSVPSLPPPRDHYHVIAHDEQRRNVFDHALLATAVEKALADTCVLHGWTVHAYVFLHSRYQLALEVPRGTQLFVGLRMLEDILAVRLHDARHRPRPLVQVQRHSHLVEDIMAFISRIDQIHLEPVRAGLVAPAHLAAHGASSLRQLLQTPRPPWLACDSLLRLHQLTDTTAGWSGYIARLMHAAVNSDGGADKMALAGTASFEFRRTADRPRLF